MIFGLFFIGPDPDPHDCFLSCGFLSEENNVTGKKSSKLTGVSARKQLGVGQETWPVLT